MTNNTKVKNIISNNYKSIVWAMIIMYLSLVNINDNETIKELLFPYSDKIAHLSVYAILSIILCSENKTKNNLYRILFAITYGIIMETLQYSLTTYRSFELYDILANTLGVILGWKINEYYINNKKIKS